MNIMLHPIIQIFVNPPINDFSLHQYLKLRRDQQKITYGLTDKQNHRA